MSVIGYDSSTMVMFQIGYNPHHEKADQPEYSYHCHGMEWGESCYSLEFVSGEIKEFQNIELQFGGAETPTIAPKKTIVNDEKRCSFCNKLSEEVEVLIEKNFLHRICNECIEECVKVIDERKA